MKKKLLSFHSECTLQRNGLDIPFPKSSKAKLKAFHLYAYYENDSLSLIQSPSIQICDINSEDSILYKFSIFLIKNVLRPFIQEGKITIELLDENNITHQQTRMVNASDMSLTSSIKVENSIFLFISQSSKEMLSHFCHLLSDLHSKWKILKNDKNDKNIQNSQNSQNINKTEKIVEKKTGGLPRREEIKSNEFEGRKKINRGLLKEKAQNNINKQEEIVKKRPFLALNQEKTELNIKAGLKKERNFIKTAGFFDHIPEIIIEKIIEFLPKNSKRDLILINKEFYNIIWRNLKHLNLNSKAEIPPNMLKKFLSLIQTTEKISFGRLKNINPSFLLDLLSFKLSNKIKEIDLSHYSKTNDRILIKLLMNCKSIEVVKLPYLSNLSKDSLLTINTYCKNLKHFELKYDGLSAVQTNNNITDLSLVNLLEKNKGLLGFNFAYVSNVFYENFFKEEGLFDVYNRLKIVKITNFVVNGGKNLENFKKLMNCSQLEYLKLINILYKNQYNSYEPLKLDPKIFEFITKGCKKLNKIKFGGWFDNEMMLILTENLKELREISLKNNQEIDDISMEIFLQCSQILQKIDISECFRINGHCLEGLNSMGLKELVVCFGDFNIKCTEMILKNKGLIQTRLINKIPKKK